MTFAGLERKRERPGHKSNLLKLGLNLTLILGGLDREPRACPSGRDPRADRPSSLSDIGTTNSTNTTSSEAAALTQRPHSVNKCKHRNKPRTAATCFRLSNQTDCIYDSPGRSLSDRPPDSPFVRSGGPLAERSVAPSHAVCRLHSPHGFQDRSAGRPAGL